MSLDLPNKNFRFGSLTNKSFGSHFGHEWTCMSWSITTIVLILLRYVVRIKGFGSAVYFIRAEPQPSSIGTSFTFRSLLT